MKDELSEFVTALNTELETVPKNKHGHTFTANGWAKYGKKRVYVNRSNGNNSKGVGFIEIKNGKYCPQLNTSPESMEAIQRAIDTHIYGAQDDI